MRSGQTVHCVPQLRKCDTLPCRQAWPAGFRRCLPSSAFRSAGLPHTAEFSLRSKRTPSVPAHSQKCHGLQRTVPCKLRREYLPRSNRNRTSVRFCCPFDHLHRKWCLPFRCQAPKHSDAENQFCSFYQSFLSMGACHRFPS